MRVAPPSSPCLLLLAAALLVLPACQDSPTVPDAIQRLAGGEEWVAVSAPVGLPGLSTWTALVSGSTVEGREARVLIRDLERRSREARREGRLRGAVELHREAERIAVLALDRAPDPRTLQHALDGIEFWSHRVDAEFDAQRFPELASSRGRVAQARESAVQLLAAGDTAEAILQIALAVELIREHAPESVALRVLGRAEQRIDEASLAAASAERALNLIVNARQELIAGDPRRALHRALYALQIVEGSEVRTVRTPGEPGCEAEGC